MQASSETKLSVVDIKMDSLMSHIASTVLLMRNLIDQLPIISGDKCKECGGENFSCAGPFMEVTAIELDPWMQEWFASSQNVEFEFPGNAPVYFAKCYDCGKFYKWQDSIYKMLEEDAIKMADDQLEILLVEEENTQNDQHNWGIINVEPDDFGPVLPPDEYDNDGDDVIKFGDMSEDELLEYLKNNM